jgi:hypothetical protein
VPLPVDHAPDVLAGREPRPLPTWRPPRRALLGGALALSLLAGAWLVAPRVGSAPAVVDASGTMVLDEGSSRLVAVPHSTQREGRDALWTGTITVDLPDRQLRGRAEMRYSWASTSEAGVIVISHSWGRLDVAFGATTCTGPIAKSAYREPRETGGALHLRCDDGSLLAFTALLERDEEATAEHGFRIHVLLDDGAYAAG